ncbi:MAG TPA: hypothetical protein VLH84_05550 [Patescibacteria group bacterium]|nr:hypothetical protein [Patescibacteria group bacterium]
MKSVAKRRTARRSSPVHRGVSVTTRVVVLGACAAVSAFLLLSGYESVYNKALPLVHTLDTVNLAAFSGSYDLATAAHYPSSYYGNFGKPQTLKLPSSSLRLDIVPPLQQGDAWLARAGTLHLLIVRQPRAGNIGMALLYCRAGFRTLNAQNLPQFGQNIFMDTDKGWRYVYKVANAKQYADNIPYIVADDGSQGKLVIDCNDQAQHVNTVVEATLLSVQGVQQ